MRVAITGSHGLIGSHVADHLRSVGHQIVAVVRGDPGAGEVGWDPTSGRIDAAGLAGIDAAVHLAGAGIADKRWNAAHKQRVLQSRVEGTSLLARTLAGLSPRPAVLLSGSAVGIYGADRGEEILTEDAESGHDFLADVCRRWEAATGPAEEAGIRVAHLRTGVVQARAGGALAKQLPLFRLGLGARLGSGRQYVSWISLEDEVRAIAHALDTDTLRGPINLAAPQPVTNAAYTAALGSALHRPAVLRVPAAAIRLALGREMADEMLLGGQRAVPAALEASGFAFEHPDLGSALRQIVG